MTAVRHWMKNVLRRLVAALPAPLAAFPLFAVPLLLLATSAAVVAPTRQAQALPPGCQASWFDYGYVLTTQQWLTCLGNGSGVSQILAGTNITISPAGGTGAVTINATGTLSVPNADLIGGDGTVFFGVTVGTGLSFSTETLNVDCETIVNGACLDVANVWAKTQSDTVQTVAVSTTTYTPASASGNDITISISHTTCAAAACTFANPSGTVVPGTHGVIQMIQDSTGGGSIGTWGSDYITSGATASLGQSSGANARDFYSYYVADSTHIVIAPGVLNATH